MERIRQWERQSSIYKPEIDALGWAVENKTGRERERRGKGGDGEKKKQANEWKENVKR